MKSHFPSDLHELCRYIASTIGYQNFSAETAIVNYYHMSGDMGPHKDISEIDHDAPLLSFRYRYNSSVSGIMITSSQKALMRYTFLLLQKCLHVIS